MAKKEERFVRTYTQGVFSAMEIWVDKVTGVNYLRYSTTEGGSMTVLLNRDGTPVVTPVPNAYDE